MSTQHTNTRTEALLPLDDVEGSSIDAGPATPGTWSQECRLDMQAIAALVEKSIEFANELVDLFVQDSWGRVGRLAEAVETEDRHALRAIAHALNGSAGSMGARRLADLCQRLEVHTEGTVDRSIAARMVSEIRAELNALVATFADAKLGRDRRVA